MVDVTLRVILKKEIGGLFGSNRGQIKVYEKVIQMPYPPTENMGIILHFMPLQESQEMEDRFAFNVDVMIYDEKYIAVCNIRSGTDMFDHYCRIFEHMGFKETKPNHRGG